MTAHEKALAYVEQHGTYAEGPRVGRTVNGEVYHAAASGWGVLVPGRPGRVAVYAECGEKLDGRTIRPADLRDCIRVSCCPDCLSRTR
jgi:hypothetical protein